jgi:argininosuccinate lyase
MTHKRNPTAAEQVQGTRSRITGRVPTSYTPADLMETAGQVVKSLQLCAGMVKTLKVNREAMLATAANSWAQASDLAAVLVQEKGLSMRTAHQIVGVMVRLAEEQGVRPIDAGPELLDSAAQLFLGSSLELDKTEMADAMDPVVAVATRRAIGSPGSPEMRRQIDASRRLLVGDEDRLSQMRQRSKTAAEKLETAIDALLA